MIEMRWVTRVFDGGGNKHLLQYRVLENKVTWRGKAGGIRSQEWSEWKDVEDAGYERAGMNNGEASK